MSLSDRDKKLLMFILPIAVLAAFWFLVLSPKRDDAAKAEQDAIAQEERRDKAEAQLARADAAQTDFASDYGEIVRLGKAIPAQVDMPSLLVQLEGAAEGTGIRFTKIATGDRTETPAPAPPPATPPAGDSTGGTTPADAGGAPAQSAPGTAAEAANTTAASADQRSAAAEQSGVDPADAQTSTSSGQGLPVGGGSSPPAGAAPAATTPAGLETVPLELEFVGDFFNLADFFHDVKRFVRVAGANVVVGGRLITIESVNYSSDQSVFPAIKAELKATIYLSPKVEGATAGATPQGPPATTPASSPTEPADPGSPSAPTPTAVATP
jgi:Tfp pilus assembly protein PilO